MPPSFKCISASLNCSWIRSDLFCFYFDIYLLQSHLIPFRSRVLDYIMLDFEGQSEKSRASCSPDPLSSSPESVNSEMEELIRSTKVNEDGSPEIKPRRVVVSSPASGLRQRKITEERKDGEEDAVHYVDGHIPPKNSTLLFHQFYIYYTCNRLILLADISILTSFTCSGA